MKKILAVLASISLSTSALATAGCAIGDNAKFMAAEMIERIMYTSSFQSKAAIINSEKGISANFLLDDWKKQKVNDVLKPDEVNSLGGKNVQIQSLFNSVFGSFDYSINNKGGNESVSVANNLSSLNQKSINPSNEFLTTLKSIEGIAALLFSSGLGTNMGGILANLLNQNGGLITNIKDFAKDGGVLDQIATFIKGNENNLNEIANSFSWDGINEYDARFKDENTTFDQAFEISQKYLAHSLNQILTNKNNEKNPNWEKKENASISDTIKWLITNLITGGINFGDWKEVLGPILTWVKLQIAYMDIFVKRGAIDYKTQDVTHIFSANKTNIEYKASVSSKFIWKNELVKKNVVNFSSLLQMLAKILSPTQDDTNGIALQKIIYILFGDSKENEGMAGSKDKNTGPSTSLIYEILDGVSGFAEQYIKNAIGGFLGGIAANLIMSYINPIFNQIPKSISNNTNFDSFWMKTSNFIIAVTTLAWSFIENEIPPEHREAVKNLLKKFSENIKKTEFLQYYNNFIGILQNGQKQNNILNKIVKSFDVMSQGIDASMVNSLNATISSLLSNDFNITQTVNGLINKVKPLFDKIDNWYNLTHMPISNFLDLLGLNGLLEGDLGRMFYTLKHYSLSNIVIYLSNFFNNDEIQYQLHLGNVAYLIQTLKNRVSINGAEKENIFDVLRKIINDPNYKSMVRTVTFFKNKDDTVGKTETVNSKQTGVSLILGIKDDNGKAILIENSLLSGLSALFGPKTDWAGSEWKDSVADNAILLNKIINLLIIVTDKFSLSNDKWVEDNVLVYTNPNNWSYELVYTDDINAPANKEIRIQYNLFWDYEGVKKKYTITLLRKATNSIFDTNPWEFESIYDFDKPLK
ncbi:MOLPALP family lipoprotein [Williamsoniiplasma somnilux]|uniref:MOLPALP family lipoprotein n=1 Tax=Williamsoniiplasma somnilux TaxID=215578 RepID=A0A2K8NZ38_9MOLU|nr:MOLPALP family lipoprotein [Williamsoniiplasma somnilux]ATZ19089.1 MOLPALP family lipoprotein [Williamsoniiplasma somnilux]